MVQKLPALVHLLSGDLHYSINISYTSDPKQLCKLVLFFISFGLSSGQLLKVYFDQSHCIVSAKPEGCDPSVNVF